MKPVHFCTGDHNCATCHHKLCAKKVSIFSNLNNNQLETVLTLVDRKRYKKGDVILHAGDLFDRLYIVNGGSLKASAINENGKEQILYLLNEGDSIGELSLLKKDTSGFDLISLGDSYLCTISKDDFDAFLAANPEIAFALLASAHDRIVSLERLVNAVSTNDADTRLRFLIQQLMLRSGTKTPKGIAVPIQLTREDMASFVGVTRETISRKLSQLSQEGLLDISNAKEMIVLEPSYFKD